MNEYAHGRYLLVKAVFLLLGLMFVYWAIHTSSGWGGWAPWLYMAAGWMFRSVITRRR